MNNAPLEDEEYQAYIRAKIERGRKDVEENRVLTEDEMEQRLSRWLMKPRRPLGDIAP
jgi:predicted transcriptional regulator